MEKAGEFPPIAYLLARAPPAVLADLPSMKKRVIWMMVPADGAEPRRVQEEGRNQGPGNAAVTAETPVQAPPPAPPIQTASLSPDERAAKLGFVKHLPQDTEVVMAFHNGSKSADRIKSSKLWKLVQSEMGMGYGECQDSMTRWMKWRRDFEIPEVEQDAAADAVACT